MASLRLIGDPDQVEELLDLLDRVAHVEDVSRRGSRYSETDVRVYAYVTPVVEGEIVERPAYAASRGRGGRPVGSRPRQALTGGSGQ